MPHLILEHSNNLLDEIDLRTFFSEIHAILMEFKVFDLSTIKSRRVQNDSYYLGDGNPQNAFISLSVSIIEGRGDNTISKLGNVLRKYVEEQIPKTKVRGNCEVCVEIREIQDGRYFKSKFDNL